MCQIVKVSRCEFFYGHEEEEEKFIFQVIICFKLFYLQGIYYLIIRRVWRRCGCVILSSDAGIRAAFESRWRAQRARNNGCRTQLQVTLRGGSVGEARSHRE